MTRTQIGNKMVKSVVESGLFEQELRIDNKGFKSEIKAFAKFHNDLSVCSMIWGKGSLLIIKFDSEYNVINKEYREC